jgi:hypothetical protein
MIKQKSKSEEVFLSYNGPGVIYIEEIAKRRPHLPSFKGVRRDLERKDTDPLSSSTGNVENWVAVPPVLRHSA